MTVTTSMDQGLSRELVRAADRNDSGILAATRGKLKRLFCLSQGSLAFAASNVIEEQLDEFLVQQGLLGADDRDQAIARCKKDGVKLGAYLVECGSVEREALEKTTEAWICNLLYSTLAWRDGEFEFSRGQPNLEGEVPVSLPGLGLVVDYARTCDISQDEIRSRIGPPNSRPGLREEDCELLGSLADDRAMAYLVERCDGTRDLPTLIQGSPLSVEETWRALYALTLIGILQTGSGSKARAVADGSITREEVLARLERAEHSDHYAVLEMNPTATLDEIREAYYFLARRYHPDRFRSGRLQDLLPQVEQYFTQVTEAYNTLHDPISRAEFDEQRAREKVEVQPEQDTAYLAKQNYLRARALIERGRFTDAATSLENAIQLNGTEAIYYLELGRLLALNPRRRPEAETRLLEATNIDPSLTDGYMALAELYLKSDRKAEAVRYLREVLRWEPGHLEAGARLKEIGKSGESEDGGMLRGLFKG